mmetsp:Transcript_9397/g.10932  ORF Transcript_9397/g.10932 Transcript_9397/m.10932 type:complete len:91 (-) Transcript_9397:777-1049(-)
MACMYLIHELHFLFWRQTEEKEEEREKNVICDKVPVYVCTLCSFLSRCFYPASNRINAVLVLVLPLNTCQRSVPTNHSSSSSRDPDHDLI